MAESPERAAAEAYYLEGRRLARKGETMAAERSLLTAVSRFPKHYRAHIELGRLYMEGDPDRAWAHLSRARELRPASDLAHLLVGRYLEGQGRWLEAAERHEGSWWGDWCKWLSRHGGAKVAAREPGDGELSPIEDAPGSYVKQRTSE